MPKELPNLEKFLSDPEFQGDRDLIYGCVDARLKHHAEEAAKNKEKNKPRTFLQRLFDPEESGS